MDASKEILIIRISLSCEHERQHKNEPRKENSLEFCYFKIDLQRRFGTADEFNKILKAIHKKFVVKKNTNRKPETIKNDKNLNTMIELTKNMPSNHSRYRFICFLPYSNFFS